MPAPRSRRSPRRIGAGWNACGGGARRAGRRVERLWRDAQELRAWIERHPEERRGPKGTVRQSNRTDNESAKLATGKGVIQGYTGAAAVDGEDQIIVEAQAPGTGS